MKIRVGMGYDVHRFAVGRELWLGGIRIAHPIGLLGHSDADVLIHAICDALLGAANARDIGFHFPDNDKHFEGIDSKVLLSETMKIIRHQKFEICNIDCTICAEHPKLQPHILIMKKQLALVMAISEEDISIKATTTEKLGFVGREEGIAAYAVALLIRSEV
jgi:2-C-methyl-D-erythritol 2,4-cyclodiphosphate synthase